MPAFDRWRLAPADRFMRQGNLVKVSHDPGDPQITSHCPFCGSGQIVGRSDGTIGCDFCGMNYIVRVQPAFPGMPQAPGMGGAPTDVGPDGMPMDPGMEGGEVGPDGMPIDPGMEGEVPPDGGFPPEDGEELPPGEEEAAEEEGGFPPEEGDGEEEGDAPPPPKKKSKSKSKSSKEGSFRTLAGDTLGEDAYIRHLAVLHSGGDQAVLDRLRAEAGL